MLADAPDEIPQDTPPPRQDEDIFRDPDVRVRFVRLYYCAGGSPKHWTYRYEISDPPTSGFSHAVVLLGEKRSTILCPYTLESFQVNNRCGELAQAHKVDISPERLGGVIRDAWERCVRLQQQRDFGVPALVLTALGQAVPKNLPRPTAAAEASRGGKTVLEGQLRPVNPASRRGQVARFFLAGNGQPQSIHEAMARLGLTRSGVLSHLFCLNRDHGVGYDLSGDCATLRVPDGFDLLAYEPPVRAEPPARGKSAGQERGEDGRVRGRGGKPINPNALCPIPEPGKRATVARLFVEGFYPIASAMEQLGLTRSAVLSHLFTINQQNGLGYELSEDSASARILVPEGHAAFEPKRPRAKREGA